MLKNLKIILRKTGTSGWAANMNERAFIYEHFEAISYFYAAFAMGYSLMLFTPFFSAPLFTLYAIICVSVILYRTFRIVRHTQKYKSISRHEQRQIIKRHHYSFKWILPILLGSIGIAFLCAKFFDLDLVQLTGVWGLSLMLLAFLGVRLFLQDLKGRLDGETP